MSVVEVIHGTGPILLGQPHGGTDIPSEIQERLNANGQILADTDWHIAKLYDGLVGNVSIVRAKFHRYVIDANRDPGGQSLYPGQNTTELCPTTDFDGKAIWREGEAPNAADVLERVAQFHRPYHAALEQEIERIRAQYGFAILFDCHSIRSMIPFLFEGKLPDFNIGTNNSETCSPKVEAVLVDVVKKAQGHDWVLNGRFKGGWTTRHYGQPNNNIHAIQLEIAQSAYMDETPPWSYRDDRASQLRVLLKDMLTNLETLAHSGALEI